MKIRVLHKFSQGRGCGPSAQMKGGTGSRVGVSVKIGEERREMGAARCTFEEGEGARARQSSA
jgi:hypothetical protein